MALGSFRFDAASQIDRPTIEQQLFRERGFTRVWMGNNRKRAAALNFLLQFQNKRMSRSGQGWHPQMASLCDHSEEALSSGFHVVREESA